MMCHLTTIVSGAVSLGVLVGVLSGIVYVVVFGLKWVGKLRVSLEEESLKGRRDERFFTDDLCTRCRTHSGTPSTGSEQCCDYSCNGSVCSSTANQSNKRSSRRFSEIWSDDKDVDTLNGEDAKAVRIREEIEKLVEDMVGGSLDGVSVGRLSNHSAYLAMFTKHHEPICQALAKLGYALHFSLLNKNGVDLESVRAAHSTLKTLIEKVVAEVVKLPNIGDILHSSNAAEEIVGDSSISSKSYEDILATAILNKVIEQCRKREGLGSSKTHKRSNAKTTRNCNNNIITNDEDVMYNSDWSDTTSRSEQLSLTIEEHIEEITTTYENSEEDEFIEEANHNGAIPFPESGRIILNGEREHEEDGDEHSSATELITTGNSWEENWLFQRKRIRSGAKSHHPVPVPMLVPNPSQDFRALIGGVDADDLSDMSECDDTILEDVVLADEDENDNVRVEEDGGTNEVTKEEEVEESVSSPVSLNSESSSPSLSQKERDVSVDYECFRKFEVEMREPPQSSGSLDLPIIEDEECNPRIRCPIAEREKEKWNHPVQLANNPYSAENILKREQRKKMEYFRSGYRSEEAVEFPSHPSEEPTHDVYSRDYFIKASRCPTGDPSVWSTPEELEEVSHYLRTSNRNGKNRFLSISTCDCLSEKSFPKFSSLRRRRNQTKTSLTENGYHKCDSCSLRLPFQRRRRRNHILTATRELDDLEEISLKENIAHIVFRAKNATPNFIINPLFEDSEKDKMGSGTGPSSLDADGYQTKQSRGQESGYGSDAHDCSDSSECWRLTPPETPEMLESSLITAFQMRRSNRGKRFYDTFPKSREIHYF